MTKTLTIRTAIIFIFFTGTILQGIGQKFNLDLVAGFSVNNDKLTSIPNDTPSFANPPATYGGLRIIFPSIAKIKGLPVRPETQFNFKWKSAKAKNPMNFETVKFREGDLEIIPMVSFPAKSFKSLPKLRLIVGGQIDINLIKEVRLIDINDIVNTHSWNKQVSGKLIFGGRVFWGKDDKILAEIRPSYRFTNSQAQSDTGGVTADWKRWEIRFGVGVRII